MFCKFFVLLFLVPLSIGVYKLCGLWTWWPIAKVAMKCPSEWAIVDYKSHMPLKTNFTRL